MIAMVVIVSVLTAPAVAGGGLLRYAMELRRAAERAYGRTAWIELELAMAPRPGRVAVLLRRIHRLVGVIVAEDRSAHRA